MNYSVDIEIKNHISGRRYISRYYSEFVINSTTIHERIIRDIESEVNSLILPVNMSRYTIEFSNELKCIEIFRDVKKMALLHTGATVVYSIKSWFILFYFKVVV